jgi:hypothetical protein
MTTIDGEGVQAVAGPAGPAPVRRPSSVRRTSTIDMSFVGGRGSQMRLHGRARDALTPAGGGPPLVLDRSTVDAGASMQRVIEDIASDPARPGIEQLVGCRGGGHLRLAIDSALPDERPAGTPLYLLLDDIAGCTLIGGFVWSRFTDLGGVAGGLMVKPRMEGVCIGFAPGSSALAPDGTPQGAARVQPVGPLLHPDDPDGWHDLAEQPAISMRRARRIDVAVHDGVVEVDSSFQDSAGDPELGRVAVHEYRLAATADLATMTVTSVEADPRILPYLECPAAIGNVGRLVGVPLGELRTVVLDRLAKTDGCTHLNDALRALAEVPVLVAHLLDSGAAAGEVRDRDG